MKKWIKDPTTFMFRSGEICNDVVTLWCGAASAFAEFDMNCETLKVCGQIGLEDKYMGAVYAGDSYWLIPKEQQAKSILSNISYFFDT